MLHVCIETVPRDLLGAFAWKAVVKLDLTAVLSINRPWNGGNFKPCDHGGQGEKETVSQQHQRLTKPHSGSEQHVNYQL